MTQVAFSFSFSLSLSLAGLTKPAGDGDEQRQIVGGINRRPPIASIAPTTTASTAPNFVSSPPNPAGQTPLQRRGHLLRSQSAREKDKENKK